MAKGSQDWVTRTDAFLQSLSTIITRNTYGGERYATAVGAVAAAAATPVFSVSGKGVIIGAYFRASSNATLDNDFLSFITDGQTILFPIFLKFKDYNWDRGNTGNGLGTLYDGTNFIVGGTAGYGATFESSYTIYYNETYGRNPTAELHLYYALVNS